MRLERLRERMEGLGIEALLITSPTNIRYISGFTGSYAFLLITRTSSLLLTDMRYIERAKSEAPSFEVVKIGFDVGEWLPPLVKKLGLRRLYFESLSTSYAFFEELSSVAPVLPVKGLVEDMRMLKDEDEVRRIKRALFIAKRAMDFISGLIKPGVREDYLAWEAEKFMREMGSEELPFPVIVASGPSGALPHHRSSEKLIKEGESVVIDLGARYKGYCSDITRTFFVGKPPEELIEAYRKVKRAMEEVKSFIKPGVRCEEAHQLAQSIVGEMWHSVGHGVGLDVHEGPRIGRGSQDVFQKGMVFTIEPGIYIPALGGVRVEDMVILEEEGKWLTEESSEKDS